MIITKNYHYNISVSLYYVVSISRAKLYCFVILEHVRGEIYNAETFDLSLDFVVENCHVQLNYLCLTLWYQRYSLCHLVKRISC